MAVMPQIGLQLGRTRLSLHFNGDLIHLDAATIK